MTPALMAALPAARIQKRFPRELVYGPLAAQGLGLPFLFTTQTIEHCVTCLRHGTQDTPTGRLLRASLGTIVLEIGSSLSFWELDYKKWSPLMTDSWIKATWWDTRQMGITIRDTTTRTQTQRVEDIFLMDAFVAAGYQHKALFALNWCRTYLHLLCLSDATNTAGSHIHPRIWECELREDWTSKYNWPRNQRPTLNVRIAWKEALERVFLRRGPGRILQLRTRLGRWRVHENDEWHWKYCPQDERLYCKLQDRWSYWRKIHCRTRSQRFQFAGWIEQCPQATLRASGDPVGHDRIIVHSKETAADEYRPPDAPVPTTLLEALAALPASKAWATEHVSVEGFAQQVAISLVKGSAIAVSDGSLKNSMGTAAYHIEAPVSEQASIEGLLQVPGSKRDGSSHRSKLGGLYGIVTVVEALVEVYGITEGAIEVGCDGESALRAFDLGYYFDPQQADFDFLSAIQTSVRASPLRWKYRHVLGHQDLHNPGQIDHWAALNIKMDSMAKAHWQDIA